MKKSHNSKCFMVLKMDTREKIDKKKHIFKYCERNNIYIVRSKIDAGDYMLLYPSIKNVVIDTKRDVNELAYNLIYDNVRFTKECVRAIKDNIKLIILIEQSILTKDDLLNWKAKTDRNGKPTSPIHGYQIYKQMEKFAKQYKVVFRFCSKRETGKKIIELLLQYGNANS